MSDRNEPLFMLAALSRIYQVRDDGIIRTGEPGKPMDEIAVIRGEFVAVNLYDGSTETYPDLESLQRTHIQLDPTYWTEIDEVCTADFSEEGIVRLRSSKTGEPVHTLSLTNFYGTVARVDADLSMAVHLSLPVPAQAIMLKRNGSPAALAHLDNMVKVERPLLERAGQANHRIRAELHLFDVEVSGAEDTVSDAEAAETARRSGEFYQEPADCEDVRPETLPSLIHATLGKDGEVIEGIDFMPVPAFGPYSMSAPLRALQRDVMAVFTDHPVEHISMLSGAHGDSPAARFTDYVRGHAGQDLENWSKSALREVLNKHGMESYDPVVTTYQRDGIEYLIVEDTQATSVYIYPAANPEPKPGQTRHPAP